MFSINAMGPFVALVFSTLQGSLEGMEVNDPYLPCSRLEASARKSYLNCSICA